jgi:ParB-like chromosome segregation protein Spo0J
LGVHKPDFKDADVQRMKLTELMPAEYNPRVISDKAFVGLGVSITRFGLLIPIVWNKRTGNIVGGHQRFRHLTEQGETETDVVVVDLDPQEEVALNITLNNRDVRGQFTEGAIGLLKMTEAKIGSVFNELALVELHDALVKKLKKKKDKTTTTDSTGDGPGEGDGDGDLPEAIAIITCPECKSRWRMRDNSVIHNAVEDGNE